MGSVTEVSYILDSIMDPTPFQRIQHKVGIFGLEHLRMRKFFLCSWQLQQDNNSMWKEK